MKGDTWRPFGDLIASLKAKVDAAIAARDEEAAARAHRALIAFERRQEVASAVRRRTAPRNAEA